MANHAPQAVDHGREGDGPRSVAIAVDFRTGSGKVADGGAKLFVDGDLQPDGGSVVHLFFGFQEGAAGTEFGLVGDLLEHVTDGEFGVLLHVTHVRLDDGQAVSVDEFGNELDALLVGGNLGFQIGEVVREIARSGCSGGVRWSCEVLDDAGFVEYSAVNEQEGLEGCPFLGEGLGVGWH